jgi:hypothetical protein
MAYELPDIKGRAIWAAGNDFTKVQTPFISETVIEEEIEQIMADFTSGKRKCNQAMLVDNQKANPENEARAVLCEEKK